MGALLLLGFALLLFVAIPYTMSSKYVLYTSDCDNRCVTVYGDGSSMRDMSKTFKCKDCYPKLKETLESTRAAVGSEKYKFEWVTEDKEI